MNRFSALLIVLIVIAGTIFYLEKFGPARPRPTTTTNDVLQPFSTNSIAIARQSDKAERYEKAKELVDPAGFINSDPFKLQDLIGKKIILLDIWTYSCINCQRTQPFLNAWYDKYKDQGLEIIGIHTPEFEFEKKFANVRAAVEAAGIHYPVILDSTYGTWNAYGNHYWPRKYLIDIDGYIVYDHIGEGGYEETERQIQAALQEKMTADGKGTQLGRSLVTTTPATIKTESPETYFGSGRNNYLENGTTGIAGQQTLAIPKKIHKNGLYLGGDWDFQNEFAKNNSAPATIAYRYEAQAVYFVGAADTPVKIRVRLDGKPLSKTNAAEDIIFENGEAYVIVQADRLYKLIKTPEAGEHQLEMRIEAPGLEAFTFTFG